MSSPTSQLPVCRASRCKLKRAPSRSNGCSLRAKSDEWNRAGFQLPCTCSTAYPRQKIIAIEEVKSGWVLNLFSKVEPAGYADGLGMVYEKEGLLKTPSRFLA